MNEKEDKPWLNTIDPSDLVPRLLLEVAKEAEAYKDAQSIVSQWDNHDRFRVALGEENFNQKEVELARAYIRLYDAKQAEIDWVMKSVPKGPRLRFEEMHVMGNGYICREGEIYHMTKDGKPLEGGPRLLADNEPIV